MRSTVFFMAAAIFTLAGGPVLADNAMKATPKPSPAMHDSSMHGSMKNDHMGAKPAMKSDHMKSGQTKSDHMKSDHMKSGHMTSGDHMMATPKPSAKP